MEEFMGRRPMASTENATILTFETFTISNTADHAIFKVQTLSGHAIVGVPADNMPKMLKMVGQAAGMLAAEIWRQTGQKRVFPAASASVEMIEDDAGNVVDLALDFEEGGRLEVALSQQAARRLHAALGSLLGFDGTAPTSTKRQ